MKKLAILILFLFSKTAFADTKVMFSPGVECKDEIISQIKNAKSKLKIVVYKLDNDIINAILEAPKREVKVILFINNIDHSVDRVKFLSNMQKLYSENVDIRINLDTDIKERHNFMIIDDTRVLTTSLDWTNSLHNDFGHCMVLSDKKTLHNFAKKVKEMKGMNYHYCSLAMSKETINKIKKNRYLKRYFLKTRGQCNQKGQLDDICLCYIN